MKKILKIIYYSVITAIVGLGLLLIVSVFPVSDNIQVLSVLSGSMEPTIHTGSIVVIKPFSEYKVGDIVTFGKNTKIDIPTTHRIAEERLQEGKPVYLTKGDANNAEDGKEISKDQIIGKVLFSIPYLGYAIDFVKKPVGFMIVIIIPAVVIVYDEIQRIFKEMKKIKENKQTQKIDEV
jgi:signal peptidase I